MIYWFGVGWVLAGLVAGLTVVLFSLAAPRLLATQPRSLSSLHASMLATAVAIVLIGAAMLWFVVALLGYSVDLLLVAMLVAAVGVVQWIVSPWIINAMYRARPAGPELAWLRAELERLARQVGMKPPRLLVAEIDAPNAFAYGNPFTGYYVAVTRGLLRLLPREEVVAVIGHELGHIRHRDVQYILALSLLPSIGYFLGRILLELGFWGATASSSRERSPLIYIIVGVVLVAASIVLHFLVRHFNRLREYYADAHSAILLGTPRPLQRALARLYLAYQRSKYVEELRKLSAAEMLFIVNPLVSIDDVVDRLKRQKTHALEEILATHPPIPKRLKFLDSLAVVMNPLKA
jgi:heat shock protein HtpX